MHLEATNITQLCKLFVSKENLWTVCLLTIRAAILTRIRAGCIGVNPEVQKIQLNNFHTKIQLEIQVYHPPTVISGKLLKAFATIHILIHQGRRQERLGLEGVHLDLVMIGLLLYQKPNPKIVFKL